MLSSIKNRITCIYVFLKHLRVCKLMLTRGNIGLLHERLDASYEIIPMPRSTPPYKGKGFICSLAGGERKSPSAPWGFGGFTVSSWHFWWMGQREQEYFIFLDTGFLSTLGLGALTSNDNK